MRALVWQGPRELSVEELPDPAPGPGELLVAVTGCGICGSDLHGYLGHSRARVPPLVLGHEIAGEVVGVGRGADPSRIGESVAVNPLIACGECEYCERLLEHLCVRRGFLGMSRQGGFAELVAVPDTNAVTLPPAVGPIEGALVELVANAVHVVAALDGAGSIGIAGGGALGLSILALAQERGIPDRLLTEPSDERRRIAVELGATASADPAERDLASLASELPARGVDVAIDAVGLPAVRRDVIAATVPAGHALMLGLETEASEVLFADVIRREVHIAGGFAYTAREFAAAVEILETPPGARMRKLVSREPLERGPDLFAALADRQEQRVKIVLDIREGAAS